MRKYNNINDNSLIKTIHGFISKDPKLSDKYLSDSHTRKYSFDLLLQIIIDILHLGLPWRSVNKLSIGSNLHWNTVYKTYMRLLKDKIIDKCFSETVNKYLQTKPITKNKIHMTDTTVIKNKLGEENIGRNINYNGKNITKISLIADSYGNAQQIYLFVLTLFR